MSIRKLVPVVAGGMMVVAMGLGVALAADGPTQTLSAGALKFEAPAAWKSEQPKTAMRQAQIKVLPVAGDSEPAELLVFAFPNGAGSAADNIKRWEGQFQDGDRNTPKAKVDKVKGKNVDVTRVEIAGRYVAAAMPGVAGGAKADNPNYRLLGAIVETKDTGYFFKMVGPDKTMNAAAKGFDQLISSLTLSN